MSLPVLQNFPLSMAEGLHKNPNFNTVRQKGPAGINAGIALKPYPTWDFTFSLENIQGTEQNPATVLAMFFGIFMATAGGAGQFLFRDPQDNTEVGAQFGVGNGTATMFQLSRPIFGQPDIIQNLDGTPTIFINGTAATAAQASVGPSGIVTFATAPANGATLTWSGAFFYLCRFSEDTIDSVRTFTINSGIDTWTISGVKFSSEFQAGLQSFGVIAAPTGSV